MPQFPSSTTVKAIELVKMVDPDNTSTTDHNQYTYYVRDASGNVMSTYSKGNDNLLRQIEARIYGSDRLGMEKPNNLIVLSR